MGLTEFYVVERRSTGGRTVGVDCVERLGLGLGDRVAVQHLTRRRRRRH